MNVIPASQSLLAVGRSQCATPAQMLDWPVRHELRRVSSEGSKRTHQSTSHQRRISIILITQLKRRSVDGE